jgi:polysaccharide export outer membrane protein
VIKRGFLPKQPFFKENKLKRKIAVLALFFGVLFSVSLFSQEKATLEYKIGAKDLLDISVFGLNDLNRTVRVSEDGTITLPLLGEVKVEGLTKTGLERKLSELLEEKYLHNPQVTVFIREYQSTRVSVLGAVNNPGLYDLLGRETLMQIISQAGGLTTDAGNEIVIMRLLADGTSNSLRISIDDLFLKGDATLNIPLQPNDIVNVPIDKTVFVYVMGQVNRPGALAVKRSNIPTLLQSIAQAGGFSERASKGRVIIKRKDEKTGREIQIKVNVKSIIKRRKKDIQLLENDVVYVPEKAF